MKTTHAAIAALAAAVLGGVVTVVAQPAGSGTGSPPPAGVVPAAGPAGRFVPVIDKNGFLCLVDTSTGECWSHSVVMGQDGKHTEHWHPLGSPVGPKPR